MGLHLPVLAPLLLGMGTWLVYVIDRILDGLRPDQTLRKRHYFYAAHRSAFLWAALAVGSCLGWLTLTRMPSEVRREDSLLFVAALIYFCLVHSRLAERWLPKELAVGLLFAAATAVPTWARLSIGHARLVPAVALFAALCWLNCVAIECWEQPSVWHISRLRVGLRMCLPAGLVPTCRNSGPQLGWLLRSWQCVPGSDRVADSWVSTLRPAFQRSCLSCSARPRRVSVRINCESQPMQPC
jgi:hypothetical protein